MLLWVRGCEGLMGGEAVVRLVLGAQRADELAAVTRGCIAYLQVAVAKPGGN